MQHLRMELKVMSQLWGFYPPLAKGGVENRTVFVSPVKTGVQIICTPMKHWIAVGVYPDDERGRNDVKQHQTNFFTALGR